MTQVKYSFLIVALFNIGCATNVTSVAVNNGATKTENVWKVEEPSTLNAEKAQSVLDFSNSFCWKMAEDAHKLSYETSSKILDYCSKLQALDYRASLRKIISDGHKDWNKRDKEAVLKGAYYIGIRADRFQAIFGKPTKVNSTISSRGNEEQWIYGPGVLYAYFTNGKLTTVQSRE